MSRLDVGAHDVTSSANCGVMFCNQQHRFRGSLTHTIYCTPNAKETRTHVIDGLIEFVRRHLHGSEWIVVLDIYDATLHWIVFVSREDDCERYAGGRPGEDSARARLRQNYLQVPRERKGS